MALRERAVTPHRPQNQTGRRSAIDGRTTRHAGCQVSIRIRKRIEEAFGWAKTIGGLRKMRHRGLPKGDWQFVLAVTAYNLVRLPKLFVETTQRSGNPANRYAGAGAANSSRAECAPQTAARTAAKTAFSRPGQNPAHLD